jgi:CRISP-associated protein Cas1
MEEPLRPLGVDIWVVDAVLRGDFRPADFEPDGPRVLLSPEARRRFLAEYERAMARRVQHPLAPGRVTIRQAVELEVRQVAQLFTGDRQTLEPIIWP